jgi:hypothetical protein
VTRDGHQQLDQFARAGRRGNETDTHQQSGRRVCRFWRRRHIVIVSAVRQIVTLPPLVSLVRKWAFHRADRVRLSTATLTLSGAFGSLSARAGGAQEPALHNTVSTFRATHTKGQTKRSHGRPECEARDQKGERRLRPASVTLIELERDDSLLNGRAAPGASLSVVCLVGAAPSSGTRVSLSWWACRQPRLVRRRRLLLFSLVLITRHDSSIERRARWRAGRLLRARRAMPERPRDWPAQLLIVSCFHGPQQVAGVSHLSRPESGRFFMSHEMSRARSNGRKTKASSPFECDGAADAAAQSNRRGDASARPRELLTLRRK